MTSHAFLQLGLYLSILLLLTKPLGWYMAQVFEGKPAVLNTVGLPLEGVLYRFCCINPAQEMTWKQYTFAVLAFNILGVLVVYSFQRLQFWLPLNPQNFSNISWDSALNTAISFATNTNWQAYSGESTMSYLTQMLGLTVQNFFSGATAIAVVVALIRGFTRHSTQSIGNFYVDVTRTILYILLPLSLLLAVLLMGQGVIQNFSSYQAIQTIETAQVQSLPMGPVASQEAIKMLGTNGGGFFNANSAHPYENPTPFSNFLEMLAILMIPAGLCYSFGLLVGNTRQGWALLTAMTSIFIIMACITLYMEQHGNLLLANAGADQIHSKLQAGGNMEGKETRFGITASALFATITTAASCGAVNAMHESFTPLGGLAPMLLMQLGEVIFGGVGSGLYGMLIFAILAVFIAGLMIGRTPEYLGKKIESFEMKMTAIVILITPLLVLLGTAIALMTTQGKVGIFNPGIHGFSEVLYAFSSVANNNGSAFAGLSANKPFYNILTAIVMCLGRFLVIIPVLAIAGSLANKKRLKVTPGTLPTHGPLFIALLIGTIILIGALTYFPALALGPIAEQLFLTAGGRV
jgi:K+-transporting ATPase ATPase A chain